MKRFRMRCKDCACWGTLVSFLGFAFFHCRECGRWEFGRVFQGEQGDADPEKDVIVSPLDEGTEDGDAGD